MSTRTLPGLKIPTVTSSPLPKFSESCSLFSTSVLKVACKDQLWKPLVNLHTSFSTTSTHLKWPTEMCSMDVGIVSGWLVFPNTPRPATRPFGLATCSCSAWMSSPAQSDLPRSSTISARCTYEQCHQYTCRPHLVSGREQDRDKKCPWVLSEEPVGYWGHRLPLGDYGVVNDG